MVHPSLSALPKCPHILTFGQAEELKGDTFPFYLHVLQFISLKDSNKHLNLALTPPPTSLSFLKNGVNLKFHPMDMYGAENRGKKLIITIFLSYIIFTN
jgi:hypothetical protein